MKKRLIDLFNNDYFSIVIISLLIGLFLGIFFQSIYSIPIRTFFNNLNPNTGKDSHTLIIDNVTRNTPNINQKDIFEIQKKENIVIRIIKKLSTNNDKNSTNTINNYFIK